VRFDKISQFSNAQSRGIHGLFFRWDVVNERLVDHLARGRSGFRQGKVLFRDATAGWDELYESDFSWDHLPQLPFEAAGARESPVDRSGVPRMAEPMAGRWVRIRCKMGNGGETNPAWPRRPTTTVPGFPKPLGPVRRHPGARFALRWARFTGLRPTSVRVKFVRLVVAGDARQVRRDRGRPTIVRVQTRPV
jgi:hypothetical protein